MRIFSKRTLRIFWEEHPDAKEPLKSWFEEIEKAQWKSFNELKSEFGNCSLVGNNRVVFNIKGNKYRLIVLINFVQKKVFIKFIGTHKEYNTVNAKNI
jgi:mRNA interferase HigB